MKFHLEFPAGLEMLNTTYDTDLPPPPFGAYESNVNMLMGFIDFKMSWAGAIFNGFGLTRTHQDFCLQFWFARNQDFFGWGPLHDGDTIEINAWKPPYRDAAIIQNTQTFPCGSKIRLSFNPYMK